LTGL
jgi:hypothetical protein